MSIDLFWLYSVSCSQVQTRNELWKWFLHQHILYLFLGKAEFMFCICCQSIQKCSSTDYLCIDFVMCYHDIIIFHSRKLMFHNQKPVSARLAVNHGFLLNVSAVVKICGKPDTVFFAQNEFLIQISILL